MEKDLGVIEEKQELTSREKQNAALASNRQATQFNGEKANPHQSVAGGARPWSYRNSLRDMSHRRMDESDDVDNMTEAQIIKKVLPTKTPTLVQIGAARELAKLAKGNGNPQFVTDQLDGKLVQTNINADFAALMGMTDDELKRIADGVESDNETRGRPDDLAAEGRNSESVDGENAGNNSPPHTTGV